MKAYNLMKYLKQIFNDTPIRYKMVSVCLPLALIPVMVIGFLSFSESKTLIQKKTSKYTMDILNETCKNIEMKFREIDQISKMVFVNKDMQNALNEANSGFKDEFEQVETVREIRTYLRKMIEVNADIDSVYIIANSGFIINVNLSGNNFTITDEIKRQAGTGDGKSIWCDIETNTRTIPMVRVVKDVEHFQKIGYLVFNIKESSLSDIYSRTALRKSGDLFIISRSGMIISHEDKEMLGLEPADDYIRLILSGGNLNNFFVYEINRKNNYIAYRSILDTPFKIVSAVPSIEYEKEIITLRNGIMIIAFICLLFIVIVSFYVSSGISSPIRKLYAMMNKVGKGDFNVISSYESRDEVGMLNLHFNNMVRQINMLIQEVYQAQLLKQKAELRALKMQINPHFLYNTLESINWLARANGAVDVGKMVKALGDLMRTSFNGEDFISLEDEIRNIKNYITIQKYRYGETLTIEIRIDSNVLNIEVPKLIIQPLVENSIVHGIEKQSGKINIVIESYIKKDRVIISVTDNGPGIKPDLLESILQERDDQNPAKIGLTNIHRRIRLYYGEEYGVVIESKYQEGTKASIHIPYLHNSISI